MSKVKKKKENKQALTKEQDPSQLTTRAHS